MEATANTSAMIGSRMRIQRHVDAALMRLRAQEFIRALQVSAFVSLSLLVLALLADKLFSLSKLGINVWIIWGGVTALAIPYILWRVYSPRLHNQLAAVLADDRLGLNARLSTAMTLDVYDPQNATFGELFFQEAEERLQRLDVTKAFPIKAPRTLWLLLIPMGLAALIHYRMDYRDALQLLAAQEQKRKAEERQTVAAKAVEKSLQDLKEKLKDNQDIDMAQFKPKQLMEQADQIAKQLKEGQRSPDEALVQLGQLKRDIQEQKEKLLKDKEFLDRLEKLSAKDLNLEDDDLTKNVSEALKMGDAALAAREMRRLANEVKNEILDNPKLSDEQKQQKLQQLQREVEKLAGALAEDEVLKQNLQELSKEAMEAGEFEALQEAIKNQMNKQGNGRQKNGEDIREKMEAVAEELERLEEDNDAALNENEQEEMEALNEAEEGLEEAMEGIAGAEEGEMAGEQNGQQMQGGKQPGGKQGAKQAGKNGKQGGGKKMAGKSGKAGQEGGQGGKQGGKQAGMGEGQGQGQKNGQPGQGLGGGPGQGARPQGNVADAGFKAEKVKGQLKAGAITGLSHFRGQGSKGEAPKEFFTTLEATEKEASSTIEMERIPADAREVVKDYFLKVKQGAGPATNNSAPTVVPGIQGGEAAPSGAKKETLAE